MPRLGDTRLQNANIYSGSGVWESTVVASDVSFMRLSRIGSGHMRGGTREAYGGPQQLKQGSVDAVATANFAFQDGSDDNFSFTRFDLNSTMVFIDDGSAGGSGGYVLPRDAVDQVQ